MFQRDEPSSSFTSDLSSTTSECKYEWLVQIIVQCVRAVLETYTGDTQAPGGQNAVSVFKSPPGSRFIDVAPAQAGSKDATLNGKFAGVAGRNRDDVREAVQRFLHNSEPPTPAPQTPTLQKRQLITQEEILAAYKQGQKVIVLQPEAIVTPLARQVAKEKGIELK
jgi:pyruvate/2-oxoglutarate dehydrogenase complex dihydrolipoamide acyltransferase (E2) component